MHLRKAWKVKVLVAQSCLILCEPMTIAHQAPLSMEFSRQEFSHCQWNSPGKTGFTVCGILQARGEESPSPGDLPDPGIELWSPALQGNSLPSEPPGKSLGPINNLKNVSKTCLWG